MFAGPEQGYRLTNQGKTMVKMGWRHVTSESEGGKMLSTMTMETNSSSGSESESLNSKHELIFKREVWIISYSCSNIFLNNLLHDQHFH